MEKYVAMSDIHKIADSLTNELPYLHDGETFYTGVMILESRLGFNGVAQKGILVKEGRWELTAEHDVGYLVTVKANCSECHENERTVTRANIPFFEKEDAEDILLSKARRAKLPKFCEKCGARLYQMED